MCSSWRQIILFRVIVSSPIETQERLFVIVFHHEDIFNVSDKIHQILLDCMSDPPVSQDVPMPMGMASQIPSPNLVCTTYNDSSGVSVPCLVDISAYSSIQQVMNEIQTIMRC